MKKIMSALLFVVWAGAAFAQTPAELCAATNLSGDDSEANTTALLACLAALAAAPPELPTGAVVAFNGECPAEHGWEPFTEGQGRFVVGAGSGVLVPTGPHNPDGNLEPQRLTPLELGDQGGAEAHTLTPAEMPSHRHGLPQVSSDIRYSPEGDGANTVYFDYRERGLTISNSIAFSSEEWGVAASGGSQPHNNMPPFIALNLCQRQ